jgi:hypothetical protein
MCISIRKLAIQGAEAGDCVADERRELGRPA